MNDGLALHEDVAALLRAVSERIVLPHYRNLRADQIAEKEPGDYVTVADRESEAALTEGLALLLPDADIVGEEAAAADASVLERLANDRVWIIDPIDGTGNYAAGKPPFGIMVALAETGRAVAGWIYDPLRDRLCHAVAGGGSFIDGKKVRVPSDIPDMPVAALATYFMTDRQRANVIALAQGRYELVDIPRCAAEQYPRLALGTNHLSIFERTLAWDHAAGVLFLNEAGGKAARWDGSDYRVDSAHTGLLGATAPRLWDDAAELLGAVFL